MDPSSFGASVLASIAANIVTAFSKWIIENYGDRPVNGDMLSSSIHENLRLNVIAQRAGPRLARLLEMDDPAALGKIQSFLSSAEVDRIAEEILKIQSSDNAELQQTALKMQFIDLLALSLGVPVQSTKEVGEELFEGLLIAIEMTLLRAVEEGILQGHELRSAIRHRELKTVVHLGLATLHERLDRLDTYGRTDTESIARFEDDYRKKIAQHYKDITLLNLDPPQIYSLKAIYVAPNFTQLAVFRDDDWEIVHKDQIPFTSLKQFISGIHRTILIGDAGVGKSTFCRILCYGLASRDPDIGWSGKHPIPIRIELREYAKQGKHRDLSFAAFITDQAEARFSSPVPPGAFEFLLTSGRALVIFDGLDEIINLSERHEICRRIEYFSTEYSSTPILVTSRRIGYSSAPLNDRLFLTCYLHEFDEDQVAEYARKWFSLHPDLTRGKQAMMALDFLEDSRNRR